MMEKFKNYLEKYIELLAGNQTEYFIAIVDVEKEFVMEFLQNKFSKVPYQTVWVERNDYADAVRQRNNPEIRQIVLLSSDSVKMIDSLGFCGIPNYSRKSGYIVGMYKGVVWSRIRFGVPKDIRNGSGAKADFSGRFIGIYRGML